MVEIYHYVNGEYHRDPLDGKLQQPLNSIRNRGLDCANHLSPASMLTLGRMCFRISKCDTLSVNQTKHSIQNQGRLIATYIEHACTLSVNADDYGLR